MTEKASPNAKSEESQPSHLTQRRTQIFEKAAYQFCVKGYDSTSMSDIADAVGITKAGLYYFVESKEHLLYLITDYGLDILDETVIEPLKSVEGSEELLRQLSRKAGLGEDAWREAELSVFEAEIFGE